LRPADILFVDHQSHPGCPRPRPSRQRRPHKGSLRPHARRGRAARDVTVIRSAVNWARSTSAPAWWGSFCGACERMLVRLTCG